LALANGVSASSEGTLVPIFVLKPTIKQKPYNIFRLKKSQFGDTTVNRMLTN